MRHFAMMLSFVMMTILHAEEPAPPSFREVWLDGKETPAMLGQGSWSIIPYSEFAQLRQKAGEWAKRDKQPPWLTRIHLDAEIRGQQLSGTAHLVMRNPHSENAWGTLAPWSLSLLPASKSMKSVTLRNGTQPRSLQLLVDRQSNHHMDLPFQVEGETRQDGLWFTLHLPASPQASLDVLVHEGLRIEWPRARSFLSGPHATSGTLQRYSFSLDSQSQELQFVVRKTGSTPSNTSLEARLEAEYQVTTQAIEAKYEIAVQRWQDRLRQLELELPESLKLTEVELKQGDSLIPLKPAQLRPSRLLITFPEQVEQRATIIMHTKNRLQPGQSVSFDAPHIVDCNTRHTLRINSAVEKLERWQWGDYSPQERIAVPAGHSGFSITLISTGFRTSAPWRSPSARLAPRQVERTQKQDSFLTLSKSSVLKVQCQLSSPAAPVIYRWNVPSGWKVTEVSAGENQAVPLWNWQPDQPLEVELEPGLRNDLGLQLTIKLTSAQPWQSTSQPVSLPHLHPISSDPWSGLYSLYLERQGTLLPDSLTVLQSPGPATPWTESTTTIPQGHWHIHDLHSTTKQPGMIRIEPWPELVRADLLTELIEQQAGWAIRYRIQILPQAGNVSRFPLRFSAPVPQLAWRNLSTNAEVQWQLDAPLQGTLLFTEPLTQPMELECLQPWNEQQDFPLMFHPLAHSSLKLPASWQPQETPSRGLQASATSGLWHYDSELQQIHLREVRLTSLVLDSPQLTATLSDNFVICEYSTILPDHTDPLYLTLPPQALLISTNSGDVCSGTVVTISPSTGPRRFQLTYRLPKETSWGLTSWQPHLPTWSIPTTPNAIMTIQQSNSMLSVTPAGTTSTSLHWIPVHIYAPALSGILLLSFWLTRRTRWWMLSTLVISICSLWLFPDQLIPISVVALTFMATLLLKSRSARRLSVAILAVVVITGWTIAQPVDSPVLAFVIAGKTNQQSDALVMLPSSALAKLKNYVSSKQLQHSSGWWVKEVMTSGEFQHRHWQLSSSIVIQNQGSVPVAMPWLQTVMPSEILVNGQPSQLKADSMAFGLVQYSIVIPPAGLHRVTVKWTTPIVEDSHWNKATFRWPGCPVQTFQLEGMSPAFMKTEVGSQALHPGHVSACGGSLQCSLFTPSAPANNVINMHADVAVHWDHRPSQSIMNVLVSYDLKSNLTDSLSLDLPRTVQLRSINLAGEKQALHSPRIRQWRLTPELASQRLTVELQRPVSGQLYLLLELPYERSTSNVIPLTGIDLVDVPLRHSFVAYSADGLAVRLQNNAKAIPRSSTQFAVAWLPTLSSLPDHVFLKMQPLASIAPVVELSAVPLIPEVSTRSILTLHDNQVEQRSEITISQAALPIVMLQGYLPPGCQLISVSGNEVLSWQQSTPLDNKRTEVIIWFQPRSRQGSRMTCSLLARYAVGSASSSLSLQPVEWNALPTSSETICIRATTYPENWKLSEMVMEQCGPWPTNSQLALISFANQNQQPVLLTWEMSKPGAPPLLTVHPASSSKSNQRQLSLVAAPGTSLPEELHILVREPALQHVWQWQSTTSLTSFASKTPEGILWTIRASKPVTKVDATCTIAPGSKLPAIAMLPSPVTSPLQR